MCCSYSYKGTRFGVQMGTITGWLKKLKLKLEIVILMIDDDASSSSQITHYLICTFSPPLSSLLSFFSMSFFFLIVWTLNNPSSFRTHSEINCYVLQPFVEHLQLEYLSLSYLSKLLSSFLSKVLYHINSSVHSCSESKRSGTTEHELNSQTGERERKKSIVFSIN